MTETEWKVASSSRLATLLQARVGNSDSARVHSTALSEGSRIASPRTSAAAAVGAHETPMYR
jgi:hypothetical protein